MTPPCTTPNTLQGWRNRAGLRQGELANRLRWSQSKVSKLEAMRIPDMRIGDVESYLRALGLELSVEIVEPERQPCGARA